MSGKLNPRQEAFIREYCVDKNGTKAAQRAGYKMNDAAAHVQASRLLRNVTIKRAIEVILARQLASIDRRIEKTAMTKAQWLEEVTAIATAAPSDLLTMNDKGKLTVSMIDIKKHKLDRIAKKMKILPNGTAEFELHPKLQALELVAKHHGWISDKLQLGDEPPPSADIGPSDLEAVFSNPEMEAAALTLARATSKVKTKGEL